MPHNPALHFWTFKAALTMVKRNRLAFWLALALAASGTISSALASDFKPRRGLSMELWNTWPGPDRWNDATALFPFPEWRRNVSTRDLAKLAAAGYDFIRLPIDPGVFLAPQAAPHRTRLFAEVKAAVGMIHDAGLKVIVDLHTIPGEASNRPGAVEHVLRDKPTFEAYTALVAEFAGKLDPFDHARTALELINEPVIDCDVPDYKQQWPTLVSRLYAAARVASPTLPLVVTGGCWGDAHMLSALPDAVTTDDNTILTFHSYAPFLLTTQGASWAGDFIVHVTGLPYPPDRLGKDELARRIEAIKEVMRRDATPTRVNGLTSYLDELLAEVDTARELQAVMEKPFKLASDFARKRGIDPSRILIGELGMIRQEWGKDYVMPPEWRIDYIRDMRKLAEKNGFGWAVWGYSGAFGMVQGFGGQPVEGDVAKEILRN